MKKFHVDFRKVSDPAMLGKTQTENEVIISPEEKVTANAEVDLQMTSEKAEDDLQITSEKAVMEVNGEIIIDE